MSTLPNPLVSVEERLVLRRVNPAHWPSTTPRRLASSKLHPSAQDTHGLSVSDSSKGSVHKAAFVRGQKGDSLWSLVACTPALLDRYRFSLVHEETKLDPGHSLIPEVCTSRFQDPTLRKEIVEFVEEWISSMTVVFRFDAPHPIDASVLYPDETQTADQQADDQSHCQ